MIPKVIYKTGPFKEVDLPKEIKGIFNNTIEKNPNHEAVLTTAIIDEANARAAADTQAATDNADARTALL